MKKTTILPYIVAALLIGLRQSVQAWAQTADPSVKNVAPSAAVVIPKLAQDAAVLVDMPWASVPCIAPAQTGVNVNTLLAAVDRPKRSPAKDNNGKQTATAAEKYAKEYPFPTLRYFRGGPVGFDPESGIQLPRGAFAVEGVTKRFIHPKDGGPQGELTRDEVVWHWNVPDPLRAGVLHDFDYCGIERYGLARISHNKGDLLAQFDARKGLRWQCELSEIAERKDEYLIPRGAASTRNGTSTVVVFSSPLEGGADVVTEIVALNEKGRVTFRTRLAGVYGSRMERNPSGNSFHLEIIVCYIDGKKVKNGGTGAHLLLQHNGQIKGVFVGPENALIPFQWLYLSEDDATAVSTDARFLYRIP